MQQSWREKAFIPQCTKADEGAVEGAREEAFVFPSGRQALTAIIQQFSLTRSDRIALPEWSSQCVIAAVSNATSIPFAEVMKYNIPVSALLFYEQWGWSYLPQNIDIICKAFPQQKLIFDCVDSADIVARDFFRPTNQENIAVVFSLSKLLGLAGGGIAYIGDANINDAADVLKKPLSTQLSGLFWEKNSQLAQDNKAYFLHLHKSFVPCKHGDLLAWLQQYDWRQALIEEQALRRANLEHIVNHPLSDHWPGWMKETYDLGAAPGMVPLFHHLDKSRMLRSKAFLQNEFSLHSYILNFNFSANPLQHDYRACLCLPVHGGINNVDDIVRELAATKINDG